MDGTVGSQDKRVYNIRKAEPEDFPKVLPMAEKFYNSTAYSKDMEFDIPSILEHFILMLTRGFVLLAEEDGEAIGMLGCLVVPFQLNTNYLVCSEAMWWVEPAYRGLAVGSDLTKEAEIEAQIAGCHKTIMSSLADSPIVDAYYESRGYVLAEKAYMRGVA